MPKRFGIRGNLEVGRAVGIGSMVAKLRLLAGFFRWYGIGLVILAGLGFWTVYGPLMKAEIDYSTIDKSQMAIVVSHKYEIYIPKIGAMAQVIPDVNPWNRYEYLEALKLGVAEASGLAHPGERGTTFLFAHSVASPLDYARYNAVFYLLDKLVIGDMVQIAYKNKLYKYAIVSREILAAKNTKYLNNQSEELLVLQTCWPAGTSWKRLVLTARPMMVY